MEYRKRVRLSCENCKWHTVLRDVARCVIATNLRENWMGTIYKKHPDWKNYNGACSDYKEGD
jgi:hypothetical protein